MKTPLTILSALTIAASLTNAAPKAELLVEKLKNPTFLTAPDGSKDFLYILEKEGRVRVFDRKKKVLLKEPALDISDKISIKMNEQGLLGMAFSPDFKSDRRLYLYYTNNDGDTRVSRFTMASATKVNLEEEVLLKQEQDFKNHNGGWLGFGPDDLLYIALGDGGKANDPKHRAQDLSTFLGKLLCIDVSTARGYTIPGDNPFAKNNVKYFLTPFGKNKSIKPEILSYGLRNPWRCSWNHDRLIIADVGQNAWEEINNVERKQLSGANFGWPQYEGTHRTKNKAEAKPNKGPMIMPVYEYKHDTSNIGGFSVTGGYVYNGSVDSLKGRYLFADYIKPHIWSGELSISDLSNLQHHKDDFSQDGKEIGQMCSFGEDPQGELYIISHTGKIYQITE
ncbi:PQQ-dependent sugar dehydrogenase [Rubritalea sp.]|uniref:PQQ-dependent sugar dehydrogenase n=1 Tax=Rubritalea sp. TaxID=2109375 RepID=UPI003EF8A88F